MEDQLPVLLVDDNPYCVERFAQIMQSLKVSYVIMESGQKAIDYFYTSLHQGKSFRHIFVKWIMPSKSGFETVKRIRMIESKFGVKHEVYGLASETSLVSQLQR